MEGCFVSLDVCCRRLKDLERERLRLAEELQMALKGAAESKAAAAERQKRFNLLNVQFQKREAEMQSRLEEMQGEADAARRLASNAQAEAAAASQVWYKPC